MPETTTTTTTPEPIGSLAVTATKISPYAVVDSTDVHFGEGEEARRAEFVLSSDIADAKYFAYQTSQHTDATSYQWSLLSGTTVTLHTLDPTALRFAAGVDCAFEASSPYECERYVIDDVDYRVTRGDDAPISTASFTTTAPTASLPGSVSLTVTAEQGEHLGALSYRTPLATSVSFATTPDDPLDGLVTFRRSRTFFHQIGWLADTGNWSRQAPDTFGASVMSAYETLTSWAFAYGLGCAPAAASPYECAAYVVSPSAVVTWGEPI